RSQHAGAQWHRVHSQISPASLEQGHSDHPFDYRVRRGSQASGQGSGRHRLDRKALQAGPASCGDKKGHRGMNISDPSETFRQEARELLDQLEAGLLDLNQDPDNSDLVNSTFRALHTIKGSGAMFGFTAVAEFVHEFETAFDRVRKGQSQVNAALIGVALDAKDHIHLLIETPDASVEGGARILSELRAIVEGDAFPSAPAVRAEMNAVDVAAAPEAGPTRWRLRFYLPADALLYGTNPLLLLEELAAIGPC